MTGPSPPSRTLRRPHPLAVELAQHLERGASVLEIGAGTGRNTVFLRKAGYLVRAIDDADLPAFDAGSDRFQAALSTHGFLHGTAAGIASIVERCAQALQRGALLYCTMASSRDERFGKGTRLEDRVYAPESGDEAGVAHAYFDERGARELLERFFVIDDIVETDASGVAGGWAHAFPLRGRVHWFVRARRQ